MQAAAAILPAQKRVGVRLMKTAVDVQSMGTGLYLVETGPESPVHRGLLGVIAVLIRLTPPTRRLATIFFPRLMRF
jgi:hypothetical protein